MRRACSSGSLDRDEIVELEPVAGERCHTARELPHIERELLDGSVRRLRIGLDL